MVVARTDRPTEKQYPKTHLPPKEPKKTSGTPDDTPAEGAGGLLKKRTDAGSADYFERDEFTGVGPAPNPAPDDPIVTRPEPMLPAGTENLNKDVMSEYQGALGALTAPEATATGEDAPDAGFGEWAQQVFKRAESPDADGLEPADPARDVRIQQLEQKIADSSQSNDWSWLPPAKTLPGDAFPPAAEGAYDPMVDGQAAPSDPDAPVSLQGTVYLRDDIPEEHQAHTYWEEVGHAFDQYINDGEDALGDEGALFQQSLAGDINVLQPTTEDQAKIDALRAETGEKGQIMVDGEMRDVELKSGIHGFFSDMWTGFSSTLENVGQGFVDGAKETFDGLKSAITHPVAALDAIWEESPANDLIHGRFPGSTLAKDIWSNMSTAIDGLKQDIKHKGFFGSLEDGELGKAVGHALFDIGAVVATDGIGEGIAAGAEGAESALVASRTAVETSTEVESSQGLAALDAAATETTEGAAAVGEDAFVTNESNTIQTSFGADFFPSEVFEEFEPGSGFSAVYNADKDELFALPSEGAVRTDGAPVNTVPRRGGHAMVQQAFQATDSTIDQASNVGFAIVRRADGEIDVQWTSGQINTKFADAIGRDAPERFRAPIRQKLYDSFDVSVHDPDGSIFPPAGGGGIPS